MNKPIKKLAINNEFKRVGILGSATNGGALQIIDVIQNDNIASSVFIYDDDESVQQETILDCPVVGPITQAVSDYEAGLISSFVIAIGSVLPRDKVYNFAVENRLKTTNIISSQATISSSAIIGNANIILPNSYIGPEVIVGNNNYITTGTYINHSSKIGDSNYFSTGVKVAGRICIGSRNRFDTGACITADAFIGDEQVIPACSYFGDIRGL